MTGVVFAGWKIVGVGRGNVTTTKESSRLSRSECQRQLPISFVERFRIGKASSRILNPQ